MWRLEFTSLFLAALLVHAPSAQTLTVTTSADVVDIPAGALVADLPGPDGVVSLREALLVADNVPGHQTVGFAIPQSDWYLPTIFPGLVLLQGSFNWFATGPVTIDGTTQTAFTGDTNPDGNEVVLYGVPLYLNGDGSVATGLHGSRVEINGSGCTVQGNTGGIRIGLWTGSGSLVQGNEADTISINRSNDNVVVGNVFQRLRITGWYGANDPASGNRIGGPALADRNYITGWGNYAEHGVPSGTTVELFDTEDTVIENNYIGTTPDGMSIGNQASTVGVGLYSNHHDLVVRDNLIAVRGVGVFPVQGVVYGTPVYIDAYGDEFGITNGVEFVGNTLGLDAAGAPVLGAVRGIWVSAYAQEYAHDLRFVDNEIAGHLAEGVLMEFGPGIPIPAGVGVRLSGNSIHDNGGLGIDLLPDTWTFGPTPNDTFDADQGANGLQNYPVLDSAVSTGSALRVSGSLQSGLLDSFTVELFASPACDPSGFGPGQLFLGSFPLSTNIAGIADFDVELPVVPPAGWVVTATATLEPDGRTSEFSACTPVDVAVCQPDLGFGGPGTAQLSVCGDPLTSGGSADLALVGAPASAPVWVAFAGSSNPTPLLGGTLVPFPPAFLWATGADASGELHLTLAGGIAAGTTLYAQSAFVDMALPGLIGFTNAVGIQFLP